MILTMSQIAVSIKIFVFRLNKRMTQLVPNHEYRKTVVENYLMFYWVDEPGKTVTVARVIYGKRDYGKMIE